MADGWGVKVDKLTTTAGKERGRQTKKEKMKKSLWGRNISLMSLPHPHLLSQEEEKDDDPLSFWMFPFVLRREEDFLLALISLYLDTNAFVKFLLFFRLSSIECLSSSPSDSSSSSSSFIPRWSSFSTITKSPFTLLAWKEGMWKTGDWDTHRIATIKTTDNGWNDFLKRTALYD